MYWLFVLALTQEGYHRQPIPRWSTSWTCPAPARALLTREAGPADAIDRGVHAAALRSHCRKGLASVEPFAAQAGQTNGSGLSRGYRGTDGVGIGAERGAWTVDRNGRYHGGGKVPGNRPSAPKVEQVVR
jgi:hypothetical protein